MKHDENSKKTTASFLVMEFSKGDKFFKLAYGMVNKDQKYIIDTVMQIYDGDSVKWVAKIVGESEPFVLAYKENVTDAHVVVYATKCLW